MSNFNELQIYKVAYDLAMHTFQFTEKMKRSFKYTIGETLNKDVTNLLLSIYKANSNKTDRYKLLQMGRENIEEIRLLYRMSKDLHILTVSRYVVLDEMIENISKQMTGWQESVSYQKPVYQAQQTKLF